MAWGAIIEVAKKESQDIIVDKTQDSTDISTLTSTPLAKHRCCEVATKDKKTHQAIEVTVQDGVDTLLSSSSSSKKLSSSSTSTTLPLLQSSQLLSYPPSQTAAQVSYHCTKMLAKTSYIEAHYSTLLKEATTLYSTRCNCL